MSRGWGVFSVVLLSLSLLSGCDYIAGLTGDDSETKKSTDTDPANKTLDIASVQISMVEGSGNTVEPGDSFQLIAETVYTDGNVYGPQVTPQVTWEILTGNVSYNAGTRTFTASDETGQITISAKYSGVTGIIHIEIKEPSVEPSNTESGNAGGSSEPTNSGGEGEPGDTGEPVVKEKPTSLVPKNPQLTWNGEAYELTVRAGEGFVLNAEANWEDESITTVSEDVIWNWNDPAIELVPGTTNEFVTKPIDTLTRLVKLHPDYVGVKSQVQVTIEYADSISIQDVADGNVRAAIAESSFSDRRIDGFLDHAGLEAKNYGSPDVMSGMVVRFKDSIYAPGETMVLVMDENDPTKLVYAYYKRSDDGQLVGFMNPTFASDEFVWRSNLNTNTSTSEYEIKPIFDAENAELGQIINGSYDITFCKKSVADAQQNCDFSSNKLRLTGDFGVVRGPDRIINNASVGTQSIASFDVAIATTQAITPTQEDVATGSQYIEYFVDPTLEYELLLVGNDVSMSVAGLSQCRDVLVCNVPIRPDLNQRYKLVIDVTFLSNTVSTYDITVNQQSATGSVSAPVDLVAAPVRYNFAIAANATHYYRVQLSDLYLYWANMFSYNGSDVAMSLYSDNTFTTPVNPLDPQNGCSTFACEPERGLSEVFVKFVNSGAATETVAFQMMYNYEGSMNDPVMLSFDSNSNATHDGQTGPQHRTLSVTNPMDSKGSYYGFVPKQNTYYQVTMTDSFGKILIFVNGRTSGGLGVTPCSTLIDVGEEQINCVFNSENMNWVTINILGAIAQGGSTYTLTVRELASSETVYQVNLGKLYFQTIGYPHATVFSKDGKVLYRRRMTSWEDTIAPGHDLVDFVVPAGDDHVFIRIVDIYRSGDFYSMQVSHDGSSSFETFEEYPNSPDYADPVDDVMSGATPVLYDPQGDDKHAFWVRPDGSGDVDWFKFCTSPAACGL